MPTGIKLYPVAESTFEIWYYDDSCDGDSIVTIDAASRRVGKVENGVNQLMRPGCEFMHDSIFSQ